MFGLASAKNDDTTTDLKANHTISKSKDSGKYEDCVEYWSKGDDGFKWNNQFCIFKAFFRCELQKIKKIKYWFMIFLMSFENTYLTQKLYALIIIIIKLNIKKKQF